MSDIGSGPTNLTGYPAVLVTLGEIKGETRAMREGLAASQQTQSDINSENKREHEEFRKDIGNLTSNVAVLLDNKAEATEGKRQSVQKWLAYLAIPTAVVGSVGSYLLGQINHP